MKRALPVLVAALIALVAFSAAFGVNTAIRYAVRMPAGAALDDLSGVGLTEPIADVGDAAPTTTGGAVPMGLSRDQYVEAILARNIFDADAIGKGATGTASTALTTLSVRLVATMVATPEEFSSALIADEGRENSAKGYGIGDHILDAEVIAIEPRKVTLRRADGNLEYLTMDDKVPVPAGGAPVAAGTEGGVEGISQLGENHYAVDRSVVDKYLGDLGSLSSMARAIPHKGPDGEVDGYRLSGIRRNSPLSQLGIKNGDVILSVNGTSLGNMSDAMGALQQLQGSSHFSFDVTRRGQQQQMEYDIR